jgi:hypothetical protein
MKKIWAITTLIATSILSGLALYKFLKWAGQEEIFDFDLNDDMVE